MTYFKDGSNKTYSPLPFKSVYMWGWLGKEVHSKVQKWWFRRQGKTTMMQNDLLRIQEVANIIKNIDPKYIVNECMGHHTCEICGEDDYEFNGEIIIKHDGRVYCCPRGVYHYILDHDYIPPEDAIEAVFHGEYYTREELGSL